MCFIKLTKTIRLTAILLSMLSITACNEMQNVSSNYNKSPASGSKPITIQGVSFANTLAVNRANFSKNVGCEFHGDETQRNCCFHPRVFSDGKSCFDYDGRITNTGHYFKCNTYSSCQYNVAEVKAILANKYDLKFRGSCAVSKDGSRVCVKLPSHRIYDGLGPDINLERYKYKRTNSL
ncbi:hypothetical protein N9K21_06730 [Amylibacter sp.]|nr:hypothetical protein [Amylibacter sp.]